MTWKNRFKLFFGLIFVLIIVGLLFVYLNYSMSRVASQSAVLEAETYSLGSDYSGIVVRHFVEEGASVDKGDTIVSIKSAELTAALAANEVTKDSLLYKLDDQNNILLAATDEGVVAEIKFPEGGFVPADTEIVEVNKSGKIFVRAIYLLSPPDYARVHKGSRIDVNLPSAQTLRANVSDIVLNSSKDRVETVITADLDATAATDQTFAPGTPVKTTLYLERSSFSKRLSEQYEKIKDSIN